jgi:hypothetical protein
VEAADDVFGEDFGATQPVKAATIIIAISISPTFFIVVSPPLGFDLYAIIVPILRKVSDKI